MTPIGQTPEFEKLMALLAELKELYPTPAYGDPSVTGEDPCERDLRSMSEDARLRLKTCQTRQAFAHVDAVRRWFTWAADARQVSEGTWAQHRGPAIPWIEAPEGGYLRAPDSRIRATIDKITALHGWRIEWHRVERDLDAALGEQGL
jgi:hypothetical protein